MKLFTFLFGPVAVLYMRQEDPEAFLGVALAQCVSDAGNTPGVLRPLPRKKYAPPIRTCLDFMN